MVLGAAGGNSIRLYIYECKVKWSWGNGPHLLSETVTTIHKCRFLGHPSINVVTVQLAHPAVNITSRKNKIFYDIKDKKKEPTKKINKKKQAIEYLEKKPEKKKARLCQYFIR